MHTTTILKTYPRHISNKCTPQRYSNDMHTTTILKTYPRHISNKRVGALARPRSTHALRRMLTAGAQ